MSNDNLNIPFAEYVGEATAYNPTTNIKEQLAIFLDQKAQLTFAYNRDWIDDQGITFIKSPYGKYILEILDEENKLFNENEDKVYIDDEFLDEDLKEEDNGYT